MHFYSPDDHCWILFPHGCYEIRHLNTLRITRCIILGDDHQLRIKWFVKTRPNKLGRMIDRVPITHYKLANGGNIDLKRIN